jgi:hypothetical protein
MEPNKRDERATGRDKWAAARGLYTVSSLGCPTPLPQRLRNLAGLPLTPCSLSTLNRCCRFFPFATPQSPTLAVGAIKNHVEMPRPMALSGFPLPVVGERRSRERVFVGVPCVTSQRVLYELRIHSPSII